ncbi:hypothetical protein MSG28_014231 [Choristoneura fumiferana]|uniref:Uncharacterized protein n=1 Tax=Choristoneura fumiferana TaxID=7141 RepID=A0ACC0JGE2_CHOFU|nr:hypothetical protein MSG28_014231 [Choristoneura fumiferana]
MWIAVVIALMAIYFIVDVLVSRSRTHKGPQPPHLEKNFIYEFMKPLLGNGMLIAPVTAMGGAADSVNSTEYLNAIEELADMLTQKLTKFWLHNSLIFYFSTIRKKQEKYIKIVNDVTYAGENLKHL